jgi:uncharacterized protein YukJ
MSLSNGYGVLIGTLEGHYIDLPDEEGRWPHYHLKVGTPAGIYECAINLKSRTENKIEYRDFRNIQRIYFDNILLKPNGFHPLVSNITSGALDFIRHPGLQDSCTRWWIENGENIIQLMRYYLTNINRIYVFGEPYDTGLGIHNIHMNQGDPVGSLFARENAIWQDGGVIYEYTVPEHRVSILLTKFQTQSLNTTEKGLPI